MSFDANQEAEVSITGTIHRLLPCSRHEACGTGETVVERGVIVQNPNGYRHDCPDCAGIPTHEEALES